MAESKIADMIKGLSSEEAEAEHVKRFDVADQLHKALQVVHPDPAVQMTEDQRIAHQLITDAIYVAHLFSLRYFQVNDALSGMSRMQRSISQMTANMAQRRPRIPLVGIAAGESLMPVAFQSEAEANSYKDSIQAALGNGPQLLHLTAVELSTTVVDNVPLVPPIIKTPDTAQVTDEILKTLESELKSQLPNPPLKVRKPKGTDKNG